VPVHELEPWNILSLNELLGSVRIARCVSDISTVQPDQGGNPTRAFSVLVIEPE
jgi:hypothetical protein